MPYITFTDYPNEPGRQYRNSCTDPETGVYACEVDEVLDGDTEITEVEHARIKVAAEAHYEANPPPPTEDVPAQPTLEEQVAALKEIVAQLAPERVAASQVLDVKG